MQQTISRRDFFAQAAAPLAAAPLAPTLLGDGPAAKGKMGIASTSFMGVEIGSGPPRQGAASGGRPGAQSGAAAPPRFQPRDTYQFLEKCHALGAGGIQAQLNGDLRRLRARAEELGMWMEGMVSIPRDGNPAPLEKSLTDAKAAGVKIVRAAMLGGRRYESFPTLADWQRWLEQTHAALKAALPVIEKHKVVVAVENHKDWTLDDFQRLLKTYESEYLQVCLDFGNNIALLDDPLEVVEALAPYAKSTHIKDMGVAWYEDGFLLSEVPLGTGMLDLPKIVATLEKANPQVWFSLEMITRDPLKVPCLTEAYWRVFPDRNGKYLARTMQLVQAKKSAAPLPTVSHLSREERARVEEENVKACLRYARERRLIA
jgi:3-oxoisoapionate decarboxylase